MIILYVSKEAMLYFFGEKVVQGSKGAINCDSSYKSIDLLCEGPIEGFVDSNGNTVNYIGLNGSDASSIDCLAEGVYYNDAQIRDSKSKLYNFSRAEFKVSFGNQIKNSSDSVSAVYTYKTKLFDYTGKGDNNGAIDPS